MSMWEPFTERARRSVVLAQEEAQRLGHNYIGTEHLLLGMIAEGENPATKVLGTFGVDLPKARAEVEAIVGIIARGDRTVQQEMVFTPRAKRTIELAFVEARELNHNYVDTAHILLALIRQDDGVAKQVLKALHVDLARLRNEVLAVTEAGEPQGHEASQRVRIASTVSSSTSGGSGELAASRIFLALARIPNGLIRRALEKLGVDADQLERVLEELARESDDPTPDT